jgi:hypothetical protein
MTISVILISIKLPTFNADIDNYWDLAEDWARPLITDV